MKRHPSLRQLSDDHHRALVLARRLQRDTAQMDAAALAGLACEVREEFEAQMEPHFRVEEGLLLPALEGRGERALVAQTRDDHTRLRALVRGAWPRSTARELGALLEKHVRFEERVLFPRAETVLSEAELASVRDAAEARRGAAP
ncbi:MAG: hemerythrin domain-containing protein [Myxococcota bacterium]